MRALRTALGAVKAIRRNPLRASLTTLGIMIGVASVIAMMEIGNGSASAFRATLESMGADVLYPVPGSANQGGVNFGAGTAATLTAADCEALLAECPALRAGSPIVRASGQLVFGGRNWQTQLYGVAPAFLEVRRWPLAEGEMFSEHEVLNAAPVCVVGQTVVRELFLGASPVGQELQLGGVPLRVLGVLESKGSGVWGQDIDDVVLAPWTAVQFRVKGGSSIAQTQASSSSSGVNSLSQTYPSSKTRLYPEQSATQLADTKMFARFATVDYLTVAAVSPAKKLLAMSQIGAVLRERHKLKDDDPDDFKIYDMSEFTATLSTTSKLMTRLLFGIAAISLLVGGIGIMNIMLVSVTERTREIGLRMAVGARSADILRQFLAEAVALCLLGGAAGIALGHGGSLLVKLLLHWPVETSLPAIAVAVAVSAATGLLFGFYPAWKASKLDPIEALRYE